MQPGLSTHVFFQHRLHPGLLDALHAAGARTGASSMTIEVFAARHHFDYTDAPAVRELAAWFRSNDVRAVLHQPIYLSHRGRAFSDSDGAQWSPHVATNLNIINPEKLRRIEAVDEVKRAIETAEQVPFSAVVLHLGLKDSPWDEPAIENSLTAIEHLKAFAAPLGVQLLLENLQNDITTPDHLLYILKAGHFNTVGVCLDLGHLHLAMPATNPPRDSGVAAAIEALGSRIAQVHVHDNHGLFAPHASVPASFSSVSDMKDEHLWPGAGTIDWPAVTASLAALPAATPGILEIVSDRDETPEQVTRKGEQTFRMFSEMAAAPNM
jgi:sugar phosphate isomerase/epimerase